MARPSRFPLALACALVAFPQMPAPTPAALALRLSHRYAAFGCFSSAGERPPTMEVARSSGGKLPPLECPGSTKLHLDMSDAVNLLMYVHDPGEPPSLGMQDGGHGETGVGMVAEYADELVGEEGEWLAKQRGAVGEHPSCTPPVRGILPGRGTRAASPRISPVSLSLYPLSLRTSACPCWMPLTMLARCHDSGSQERCGTSGGPRTHPSSALSSREFGMRCPRRMTTVA